jgi:uncharacterized protein (DUF1697 family)
LRTAEDLEKMIDLNPFGTGLKNKSSKAYVSLLDASFSLPFKIPLTSEKKDYQIVGASPREIFSLSHQTSNGRYGNPAGFIEKEIGDQVEVTTRNWATLLKLSEMI